MKIIPFIFLLCLSACALGDLFSPQRPMCEVGALQGPIIRNDTSYYNLIVDRVYCSDTTAWRRAHPNPTIMVN